MFCCVAWKQTFLPLWHLCVLLVGMELNTILTSLVRVTVCSLKSYNEQNCALNCIAYAYQVQLVLHVCFHNSDIDSYCL